MARLTDRYLLTARCTMVEDRVLLQLRDIVRLVSLLQTNHGDDRPTIDFLDSMKKAMEVEWWVTRFHMEARRSPSAVQESATRLLNHGYIDEYDEIIFAWDDLAHILGLDDEEESQRFHRSVPDRCTRFQCQYSRQALPEGKPKTCAGCGEVYYCSRECQKRFVVLTPDRQTWRNAYPAL